MEPPPKRHCSEGTALDAPLVMVGAVSTCALTGDSLSHICGSLAVDPNTGTRFVNGCLYVKHGRFSTIHRTTPHGEVGSLAGGGEQAGHLDGIEQRRSSAGRGNAH